MSGAAYPDFPVAIVDDEDYVVASVSGILRAEGITNLLPVTDPRELVRLVAERGAGVVLLDLAMPGFDGMELLARLKEETAGLSVAMVTGNKDLERAVECMKLGAADYLLKPVERSRLVTTVRRLVEIQELSRENVALRDSMLARERQRPAALEAIVGDSEALDRVLRYTAAIAPTGHPVLITGETGVGKELFARAVHALSGRPGEFVAVNAAGHDEAFLSDLLFGHRAGAYTGASAPLGGLIDRARDGTLFLDEIGDLDKASQTKLLRVIETGEYYPLGSDLMKRSRARIVVATNRELEAAIAEGSFRKDLFYRLQSHRIRIPPLRERRVDLPALVSHFAARAARELGKDPPRIGPDFLDALGGYPFPGNVRELETLVFEAVNAAKPGEALSPPTLAHVEGQVAEPASGKSWGEEFRDEAAGDAIGSPLDEAASGAEGIRFPDPLPSLRRLSELLVDEALARAGGNQSQAARLIGVSPQAISKRLKVKKRGN